MSNKFVWTDSELVLWTSTVHATSDIFVSDVIDTGRDNDILSAFLYELSDTPELSITFAFRASNTQFDFDDTETPWTSFLPYNQTSNSIQETKNLGIFISGRYQQVKLKSTPKTGDILTAIQSFQILTSTSDLLTQTSTTVNPGTNVGQILNFDGEKTVDKVSLTLSVTRNYPKTFIVGDLGRVSWAAANFQSSRQEWVFQPIPHWSDGNNWATSGVSIQNTLQFQSYDSVEDVVTNAPFLKYDIFVPDSGVWHMWGYGYTSGNGLYWSLDDDKTDLHRLNIGSDASGYSLTPFWTHFGDLYFKEGGLHTLTVYLAENEPCILDQWLLTTDLFEDFLSETGDNHTTPVPISKGPFMTIVRLRSLEDGNPVPVVDVPNNGKVVSAYLSSNTAIASGKQNYSVQNSSTGTGVVFDGGLFLEFMQVGGNQDFRASWDYNI